MEKRKYEPQIYTNEDLKGKCGVYQIRNIINNKIYVGSSQNLYIRKREHFYTLSKGIHRNKHLQNAFNSYGKENMVFEIIEFCDIRDQINIEQYWIDTIQKYTNIYNIQPIADKITITEESKRDFETWEDEYNILGKRQLGYCEYVVEYEDNTEEDSYMEHDFVGYLPITEYSINMH